MGKSKTALVALAWLGAMAGAQAADVSLSPQTLDLGNGAAVISHIFAANSMDGTFSDRYNFSLSAGSSLAAQVSAFSGGADALSITGLTLYSSAGMSLPGSQLVSGAADLWSVGAHHLAADNYYLLVTGAVLSDAATAYAGTVTAVPEPEIYAMLLGGLGALGLLARRRKLPGGSA